MYLLFTECSVYALCAAALAMNRAMHSTVANKTKNHIVSMSKQCHQIHALRLRNGNDDDGGGGIEDVDDDGDEMRWNVCARTRLIILKSLFIFRICHANLKNRIAMIRITQKIGKLKRETEADSSSVATSNDIFEGKSTTNSAREINKNHVWFRYKIENGLYRQCRTRCVCFTGVVVDSEWLCRTATALMAAKYFRLFDISSAPFVDATASRTQIEF